MENQTSNQSAEANAKAASATQNTNQATARQQSTPPKQQQQPQANASVQSNHSTQTAGMAQTQAGNTAAKPTPAMTDVLADSAVPPVVCEWLTCLRRPALSMQYSVQKRHVPDLDNDTGTTPSGMDSDDMNLRGGFTIRYFDLAAGALVLATAGCLIKLCCAVKRKMF